MIRWWQMLNRYRQVSEGQEKGEKGESSFFFFLLLFLYGLNHCIYFFFSFFFFLMTLYS